MHPDLHAHWLGQDRELACQQRADIKWSAGIRDARFPIPDIEPKLFEWIGYPTFEIRCPRLSFSATPPNQFSSLIDLAWEMVSA